MLSGTLHTIEGFDVGKHPLVSRLLKAIYNVRTPKARYNSIWDADAVLSYLRSLGKSEDLEFKQLTLKTILLLALATFARVSELAAIDFHSLRFAEKRLSFTLLHPRKTQRSGTLTSFSIDGLPDEEFICPVECLRTYLSKSENLRSNESTSLFIALKPPHQVVGKATIARWIKKALCKAGVDTSVFSAHSTRGAAASKAHANGVPCDQILAAANWSRASTFHRFYRKRIEVTDRANCQL